ncbi:MAG: amidase [Acidobacteriota bacterium]
MESRTPQPPASSPQTAPGRLDLNRRRFVAYFSALGMGSTLMPGALTAVAQEAEQITPEMIESAARIAGLSFTGEEMQGIARRLNGPRSFLRSYELIRAARLDNGLAPALVFHPLPAGFQLPTERKPMRISQAPLPSPQSDEELAFLSVRQLARLIEGRTVSSTDLTKLYLARLKKYDPILHCVVNLTEELALGQARKADQEIAAGDYKGPLHGIPWGAKDLLAVRGTRTTWGASPYREQVIDRDATVFTRLSQAGAVLVAKLAMGALAQGDRWFGGMTRNPWNTEQGSSGSSAGPASATAAGLVGFSIGTETRGSIISPSRRCGVSGLRPTFGRVSRHGAMALSWSMDKIGPLCRSAEDCALVLDAIQGPDGKDTSLLDVPFNWDASADLTSLRVGYLASRLEREIPDDPDNPRRVQARRENQRKARQSLEVIRSLGVQLKPIELPEVPSSALSFILTTEAAAAFDGLTRSERDNLMHSEPESSRWPDAFRLHRFVPAVEYIQANRLRTRLMDQFNQVFDDIDLFVGSDLGATNLTGHPEIAFPNGFSSRGTPTSLSLTGKLFGEAEILRLAQAFQDKTDFHKRRPQMG